MLAGFGDYFWDLTPETILGDPAEERAGISSVNGKKVKLGFGHYVHDQRDSIWADAEEQ